jgi:hypothetical protein
MFIVDEFTIKSVTIHPCGKVISLSLLKENKYSLPSSALSGIFSRRGVVE